MRTEVCGSLPLVSTPSGALAATAVVTAIVVGPGPLAAALAACTPCECRLCEALVAMATAAGDVGWGCTLVLTSGRQEKNSLSSMTVFSAQIAWCGM